MQGAQHPKRGGGKRKYSKAKEKVQYKKKYPNADSAKTNTISEEEGFTGEPEQWFDDKAYYKQFVAPLEQTDAQDYYFGSYSHFHIHEEMLKDEVRTKSYMLACLNNKEQIEGKIVLDVGCGTGILSLFALKAGAKHVYAVDNADIAYYAGEIAKNNGYEAQITVIKGKIEEIELPVDKVDIIISEWMGYFLLYESMLDCILFARDKWLTVDGLIIPDRATLNIAAIEDAQYKQEKFGFWDNVYGIDMKCIKKVAFAEPLVDKVYYELVMSTQCTILDIDLYTATKEELDFSNKYSLIAKRNDIVHALVGWFEIYFEKLNFKVRFTTGPFTRDTHWKQTVFYLNEPINMQEGEELYGSIAVRKGTTNFRDLDIKLSFHHDPTGEMDTTNSIQLYKLK